MWYQRIIIALTLLLSSMCLYAQDESVRHYKLDVAFGLNTDGYEGDLGFSWWPVRGFGFKASIGLAGEIEEISDWGWINGYEDDYGTYDYVSRFKFMPSIEMRSPALVIFGNGATSVHLFANPGLCMSPGGAGSRGADWLTWQLRGGLELDFDEEEDGGIVISLGGGFSNYNLYSGDPISHNGSYDQRSRHTYSVYVALGYRF